MKRLLPALGAALALGCTAPAEQVNPLAGGPDAPPHDAGPADAGDGGLPEAGPVKRTVEQRNPFGNVAETENLLWDGDFEWYSPFADEYGWWELTGAVTTELTLSDVRVGAACRSGLKCAALPKSGQIVGIAVASRGNKLQVSLWAHLSKGTCAQVIATLSDLDYKVDPSVAIHAVSPDPDAAGWCHYDGVVDPRSHKPGLFIYNSTGAEILIDDAVIKKAPSAMTPTALHGPLTAEISAAIDAMQSAYVRRRGPHDAPPNAARAAFEQWRAK